MIISNVVSKKIFTVLNSNRKVGSLAIKDTDLCKYMETINQINGLEDGVTIFRDVPLDQWMIAVPFKDFIIPEKVSLEDKSSQLNLIDKSKYVSTGEVLTKDEFCDISQIITNAMRSTASLIAISSLRIHVILSNVANKECYLGKVFTNQDPFFPLNLTVRLMKETYFNQQADEIVINLVRAGIKSMIS